jgi:hypothetical protein
MAQAGPTVFEGRVVHKTSNALKITIQDGPADPLAVGVQGAGDGKGKKFATLLGFKNGGAGNHVLTYRDGTTLAVASRDSAPTLLTRADGSTAATITRGATSTAVDHAGVEILRFVGDPDGARTPELFRLLVVDPAGARMGRLDIIRKADGWSLAKVLDVATSGTLFYWWDHAGQALPIPILGTRVGITAPLSDLQRDVLLAACVDIAIGLRPYISEMN